MSDLFDCCPLPAAISIIPSVGCPVRFGQIQKVIFQRRQAVASVTEDTILLKATWDALLAADDDTRAVISPYFNNFVIGKNEILKEGGNDNTTINGIPRVVGMSYAPVTAELRNVESAIADAMRAYTCESSQNGYTNLWAYFVNQFGKIIGKLDADDEHVNGFDVYNLAVPDVSSEGFGKDNIYFIDWSQSGGWSEGWKIYSPTDFSALNLVNDSGS